MWHCLDTFVLGFGMVDLHRVWCHALFKGKAMRTEWKGVHCGLTSKLLSRTTDDCHPKHSNLCHGQMTTFILSVDRHVILKRFREEAPLFCLFYLTSPHAAYWSYLSFAIIGIICYWYEETILGFIWSLHYGCLQYNWVKLDPILRWNER